MVMHHDDGVGLDARLFFSGTESKTTLVLYSL